MFLPLRVSILSFRIGVNSFVIQGRPPVPQDQRPLADSRIATPGYFSTMGIALRQGRLLDAHDDLNAKRVALVNEAMVRKHFRPRKPARAAPRDGRADRNRGRGGGCQNVRPGRPGRARLYVPHMQHPAVSMGVAVRTAGDPVGMAPAVRREILKLDAEQPVSNVRTMQEVLSDSLMLRRARMLMLTVFALLALRLLATVGIYGLTAYSVSRRTHEIGLRMALGASRPQFLRLVVGRELVTSIIGAASGVGRRSF